MLNSRMRENSSRSSVLDRGTYGKPNPVDAGWDLVSRAAVEKLDNAIDKNRKCRFNYLIVIYFLFRPDYCS